MAGTGSTAGMDDIYDPGLDTLIDAMEQMRKANPEKEEKSFDELLEELEKHPAFMKEVDFSKPLNSDVEGLMQLKYESEDPTAKAEAYKEDGNAEFKKKKYRIAIDNYAEGIKCQCPDRSLNAILYTNRAAAQFHLGNFRSSFNDCRFARKFKPDHLKALLRGALCCLEMKKYEDCVQWCDDALNIEPLNKQVLETRQKASKLQKQTERDRRKEEQKERNERQADLKLLEAIKSRGIKLAGGKSDPDSQVDPQLLSTVETHNAHGARVQLKDDVLYWPVMFLYPEFTESDYIQSFSENHRLIDHLNHMFGVEVEPPPWDKSKRYTPDSINVYFEDREKEKLFKVGKDLTLLEVLKHERYRIYGGTPTFILIQGDTEFEKSFLAKYDT